MMHTLTFRKESFSRKDINGRFDLLTDEENTIDVEFGGCQDTGLYAIFLMILQIPIINVTEYILTKKT